MKEKQSEKRSGKKATIPTKEEDRIWREKRLGANPEEFKKKVLSIHDSLYSEKFLGFLVGINGCRRNGKFEDAEKSDRIGKEILQLLSDSDLSAMGRISALVSALDFVALVHNLEEMLSTVDSLSQEYTDPNIG